jgi:hypothetical protein
MKFPRIEVDLDGDIHGMLLDTGTSMTILSEALRDDRWEGTSGSIGDAAYFGGSVIETVTIPKLSWGPHRFDEVTCVTQRRGAFEDWMSSMTDGPIVGALGGNVLRHFKITIDYRNERLFVQRS